MIRKLAGSVRQYKKDTLLAPAFVTMEAVMEVVIPLLMAVLIDQGIEAGDMGTILKVGAALAAATLISLAFGFLAGRSAAKASAGFAANLRQDMFHKVQGYSFDKPAKRLPDDDPFGAGACHAGVFPYHVFLPEPRPVPGVPCRHPGSGGRAAVYRQQGPPGVRAHVQAL